MAQTNYLYYNVILLKIGGLYKRKKFKTFGSKLLMYTCRTFFVAVVTLFFSVMLIEIIRKGIFNFSENALGYAFLSAIFCALQRAIYYCINDDKLDDLVLRMNEIFKFKTETLMKEKSIESSLSLIKKLTFIWVIYGHSFMVLFCLYPLYTGLHKDRILPLPMWVPYDYKTSPAYELTYFLQAVCLLVTTFLQTALDMFFACITLITAQQFRILGWELKNLLFTKLIENGVPKEIVSEFMLEFNGANLNKDSKLREIDLRLVYDLCYSEKFNEDVVRSSKKIFKFHQSLLQFCTELESFFAPIMLLYYIFLMVVALFLNFAVVSTRDMAILLKCLPVNLASYFDIFVSCLFASTVTTQAERLREEAYELPWYVFNKKFQINYVFVLYKMNKPIGLTLGKFIILGPPLFLWTVRTLNSYSVVLYQFYQAKEMKE